MATYQQVLDSLTQGFGPEEGDFNTATLLGEDVPQAEKEDLIRVLRAMQNGGSSMEGPEDEVEYEEDEEGPEKTEELVFRVDAIPVVKLLLGTGRVEGVYLFGSLARNGVGHDFDLVAVVSEVMANRFFDSLWGQDFYRHLARSKFLVAQNLLGFGWSEIAQALDYRHILDLVLFPPSWLGRLDELQRRLPHRDPKFMENIARDALRFNPETEQFESLKE